MWNGILAVVIGVLQITAMLLIEKRYVKYKKEERTWATWLLYGTVSIVTCLLDFLILRQETNWLMIWNFIAISTVVLISGVIDFHCHKIPNRVLLAGAGCRILLLLFMLFFLREDFLTQLLMSVIGCVVSLLVMLLISMISKQGIGYGDVKLYACIGFYLGLLDTYYVLFYAVFLAALYAVYVLLVKRGDRKTKIPFGPFTYFGFVLVYVLSFM